VWVSACKSVDVNGARDRGSGRKAWEECVTKDLVEVGLHREWALDGVRWRGLICRNRPNRASMDNVR